MGFTLGLPPGYYAPQSESLLGLIQRLKSQNGVILPSTLNHQSTTSPKRKVFVSNLPPDLDVDAFINIVTRALGKRIQMQSGAVDESPITNFVIHQSRDTGVIEFRHQKDAEAAVSLHVLVIDSRQIGLQWYMNPNDDENDENVDLSSTSDSSSALIIDSAHLPSTEDITQFFASLNIEINSIERCDEFNHAIVHLGVPEKADFIVFKYGHAQIQGTPVTISRCFRHVNEGTSQLSARDSKISTISEGPTKLLSVVSPLLRQDPSIADILNCSVPTSVMIHPETEMVEKVTFTKLLLYNIVPNMALYDSAASDDVIESIRGEVSNFGKVINIGVHELDGGDHLPSEYAVVEIEFNSPDDAHNAQINVAGRRFCGRIVITQLA